MTNVVIFAAGLAVMSLLMMRTKLPPYACMLICGFGIGVACGLGASETACSLARGFAYTCRMIGLMIILGTVLGEYVAMSGGCVSIASTILGLVGSRHSGLALTATGYLVSIPVFSDVALVLLAPVIRSVAREGKKNPYALGTTTTCALISARQYVPPAPQAIAVITILGLDVGVAIAWGLVASLFVTLCAWAFSECCLARKPESWFTHGERAKVYSVPPSETGAEHPAFFASALPVLVPMVLIVTASFGTRALPADSPLASVLAVVGSAETAIAIGIIVGYVMLGSYIPEGRRKAPVIEGLKTAIPIVFIISSGGALSGIVQATGIGDEIAQILISSPIPVLLIPFLIAGFAKFAQGSANVAAIIAAGLTLPMCENGLITPLVAFLSVTAGVFLGSHINYSMFWVFAKFIGCDVATTLKTLCVELNFVMAFTGLFMAYVINLVV